MGTGYTRNDVSNNIADGNIINASDLDGEFDAVESAFNSSTGHTHDGTAAEGGAITVVGPVQDLVVSATEVKPKTTNTLDLGTSGLLYKDAYLQGNMYFRDTALKIVSSADGQLDIDADVELELVAPTVDIDASTAVTIDTATLTVTGSANVVGDLDVDNININGNTIISTDTNGNIALTPNGTGEVDISKVDIDSGAIDGVTLGTNSAVTEAQVDNININGNTIISTDTNGDINLSPNGTGTVVINTDLDVDNININGNTISSTDTNGNITLAPNGTGVVALSSTDLTFGDNDKAIFGAGSDLQIYHDGSHSYVKDLGTGNLNIQSNGTGVVIADSSASDLAVFNATSGVVSLYYSGAQKLQTTNTGIDVTGTAVTDGLTVAGNVSVDGGTIKLDGNYPVGTGNVALGDQALDDGSLSGSANVAIGTETLTVNTTGSNNTVILRWIATCLGLQMWPLVQMLLRLTPML
jgi:cytoskeletal protein CcmA (bactofilin family)